MNIADETCSTLVGQLLAADGITHRPGPVDIFGSVDPTRATSAQPQRVPLVLDHDENEVVGEVLYAEVSRDGSLWITASTAITELDHRTHLSGRFLGHTVGPPRHVFDWQLARVSLTDRSAAGGLWPVELVAGHDIHRRGGGGLPRSTTSNTRGMIERAAKHLDGERRRVHPTPRAIHFEGEVDAGRLDHHERGPVVRAIVDDELVEVEGRWVPASARRRWLAQHSAVGALTVSS